jgi:hypothetical protein
VRRFLYAPGRKPKPHVQMAFDFLQLEAAGAAERAPLAVVVRQQGGMLFTPKMDTKTRAFCGPLSMSAVTGCTISEARDAVRKATGNMFTASGALWPVSGMDNPDLLAAMAILGWKVVESGHHPSKPKPYRFGEFLDERGNDGPFIVNVTDHYVAVGGGEFCETFRPLPADISRCRRRGRWVQNWWKFGKAGQ